VNLKWIKIIGLGNRGLRFARRESTEQYWNSTRSEQTGRIIFKFNAAFAAINLGNAHRSRDALSGEAQRSLRKNSAMSSPRVHTKSWYESCFCENPLAALFQGEEGLRHAEAIDGHGIEISRSGNSAGNREVLKMKRIVTYVSAAVLSVSFAMPAFAQSPAATASSQVDPALIAQLEKAAQQDIADGRNGNKNNPAFGQKAYDVNQLIERLKRGEKVNPSDIDLALEPAHVW
jgi:hypothetical protein